MVEFKLPLGSHYVTVTQKSTNRFRADCSCGWGYSGTHTAVLDRAAVHDLDPLDEKFDQCDRCDKVVLKGELFCHRGAWLCESCQDACGLPVAPLEKEIERAQRYLANLLRK